MRILGLFLLDLYRYKDIKKSSATVTQRHKSSKPRQRHWQDLCGSGFHLSTQTDTHVGTTRYDNYESSFRECTVAGLNFKIRFGIVPGKSTLDSDSLTVNMEVKTTLFVDKNSLPKGHFPLPC